MSRPCEEHEKETSNSDCCCGKRMHVQTEVTGACLLRHRHQRSGYQDGTHVKVQLSRDHFRGTQKNPKTITETVRRIIDEDIRMSRKPSSSKTYVPWERAWTQSSL